MSLRVLLLSLSLAVGLLGAGCGVVGANEVGSCDRRTGTTPKAFCQEIIDTVALKEFREDCRAKLAGKYVDDLCPRAKAIGGCAQDATNKDGSLVVDWHYDVSAEPNAKAYAQDETAKTADDVKRFCADKKRYEEARHFVSP